MERHCYICSHSFALLIPVIHNEYLASQINILFDLTIENGRGAFFVCHQCKEIVANMHEFYLHVKRTQSFFPDITGELKQKFCRICGCSYENLTSLFDDAFLNKIYKLFKLQVTAEDTLPTVVCKPCQEIINNNWKLHEDILTRQKIFLNRSSTDLQVHHQHVAPIATSDDTLDVPAVNHIETSALKINKPKQLTSLNSEADFINTVTNENVKKVQSAIQKRLETNNESVNPQPKKKMLTKYRANIKQFQVSCSQKHLSCNKITKTINVLPTSYNNMVIDDALKYPKCDICKKLSTNTEELLKHYYSRHNQQPECGSIKFCIMFNNYSNTVLNNQKQKMSGDNDEQEPFACMCCNRNFNSMLDMFHHERKNFLRRFNDTRCRICSRSFDTRACYNYHIMLHKRLGDFKCDKCSKSFLFEDDLNIHIKAHEVSFINTCPICELDFMTSLCFKQHWMTHKPKSKAKQFPLYCAICGFGYTNRDMTYAHLITHKLKKDVKLLLNQR